MPTLDSPSTLNESAEIVDDDGLKCKISVSVESGVVGAEDDDDDRSCVAFGSRVSNVVAAAALAFKVGASTTATISVAIVGVVTAGDCDAIGDGDGGGGDDDDDDDGAAVGGGDGGGDDGGDDDDDDDDDVVDAV